MDDLLDLALLMYLDEDLVRNMSSFVLNGYIEIRTSRIIQDLTLSGRAGIDLRDHCFDEDRTSNDEREGFKGSNITSAEHCENTRTNNAGIENREFVRREEELKRVFTTFNLHGELITQLKSSNRLKSFYDTTINEGDVFPGDYIQIHGNLTSESINSYLDSVLTIFDCFGSDNLDKMISKGLNGNLNFKNMNHLLSHLSEILNKNSTQDLILQCGDTPVVLNVNNNFFMNNSSYIYDKVDCPCTVYGKVINVAPNGKCISLLRKTAQHDYYEHFLNNCCPFCDQLTSNGVLIPKMLRLKCEGVSIIVVPISICL